MQLRQIVLNHQRGLPVAPVGLQLACCLQLAVAGLLVVLHAAEEVDVDQNHVGTGGEASQARLHT